MGAKGRPNLDCVVTGGHKYEEGELLFKQNGLVKPTVHKGHVPCAPIMIVQPAATKASLARRCMFNDRVLRPALANR